MSDDRALIHEYARHKFWEVIIHLALNPTFKALPSTTATARYKSTTAISVAAAATERASPPVVAVKSV